MTKITDRIRPRWCLGILVVYLGTFSWKGRAELPFGLIPSPVSVERHDGRFHFTSNTCVAGEGVAAIEAEKLVDALAPAMGFRMKLVRDPAAENCISLSIDVSARGPLGEEGYELGVYQDKVVIRAAAAAGLFYGIQTLRQLLPA
ncbi:MAG: glycoside hydrolase family 20 zincin-like fold domain-containing protein, partial [Verrucomicrobiales bacterium]|nr:glycoside hydrolase family 20 zincin-like fold domain-containing protein [Verrucomicrobiales bacterium]